MNKNEKIINRGRNVFGAVVVMEALILMSAYALSANTGSFIKSENIKKPEKISMEAPQSNEEQFYAKVRKAKIDECTNPGSPMDIIKDILAPDAVIEFNADIVHRDPHNLALWTENVELQEILSDNGGLRKEKNTKNQTVFCVGSKVSHSLVSHFPFIKNVTKEELESLSLYGTKKIK